MRLNLLRLLTVICFLFLFSINSKAQNCIPTNINGATINLLCNQVCSTLVFQIPHIKGTSDYVVSSIPYKPYPYLVATSNELTTIYVDDNYSDVINMPFSFCFYDAIYSQCVAGSNGLLTFDIANAAPCGNSYNQNFPIPYISFNICSNNIAYYPQASIMGMFTDLWPIAAASSPDRKIGWHMEGTAPCRKFVLNYYHVGMYGNGNWSLGGTNCNSLNPTTFQIVLHESTGLIDINIERKGCNGTAGTGYNAILGIQDFTRTKAVAAPGKNATIWNETNKAYRFTPSGPGSRFVSSELYTIGGTFVMLADTLTTVAGLLDVRFPNACFPAGSNQYVIKTIFSACDNPLTQLISFDTITINRLNSLGATATKTDASCGPPDGAITVTVPPGIGTPPYTFVLDGVTTFVGPSPHTFTNVASGPHTIDVTDASAGCFSTVNITVNLTGTFPATTTTTATSCPGANNGSIIVNSAGGIGPYTFSIDGSLPLPGIIPYTFPGLTSGVHTVIVNDIGTGCNTGPLFINVPVGLGITGFTSTTQTSCPGVADGIITATALSGTAPFTWSLDGGPFVPGTSPHTFPPVAAGPHVVRISDNLGCIAPFNADVLAGPGIIVNASSTPTACATANNGTITITPTNGTAPYTYSLDGAPAVPGGVPYFIPNQPAGLHTIIVNDATGCSTNPAIIVIISAGSGVSGTATPTATTCPAASNGQIIVDATAGIAPFTYQLDGGLPQSSPNPYTFPNVTAGLHTVVITDNFGCTFTINNVNVNAGPSLAATTTTNPTTCSGASNGSITVTPTNGLSPFMFSLDGAPPFSNPVSYTFNNVSAGIHNIIVTDASGCTTTPPVTVTVVAGPMLTTTANVTDVLCNGGSTGTITVVQPTIGTAPYEYSLNGGPWQSSNFFGGRPAGTYTVGYRESNGCMGSHQEIISEPAAMTSSAVTVAAVCNGDPNGIITITAGGGVAPYQYSINGGLNWQASNVFNRGAGIYTIIIRDANNCATPQFATVTEPAVLTATSVNGNASCDGGDDGMITVNAAGGNSGYTYSIDGVNFQALNVFNVAPGPYTITVKDNLGCITPFNTVVGLTNNLTFTPQVDPTICEGNSTQLQLISNATIYSWTPATSLSNSTIPDPVANPTVTTQYTVTATLGRCSANDIVIVNVNSAPVPDAGPDGFICYGQTYQLQGSGGVQYTWTPSTNLSSTSISNPVSTPVKTITYTLSDVIDAIGCKSLTTDQVIVDVTPPIKVKTYPYDTISYPGDQFQLNATSAATFYSWSPVTGLSNPDIANPVLTVGPLGTDVLYQVTAYTAAGCKGEGYVSLKVYNGPELYVPSAFTPNGDGLNDLFYPLPVGIRSINYFRVFNRWGQMLFTSTTLNKGWDGKLQGVEQPTGTYVFMAQGVDKNGKLLTRKGTVTLIK